MTVKEIRERYGLSRAEFCRQLGIPPRTVEDWDAGKSKPSEWVVKLIDHYMRTRKEA